LDNLWGKKGDDTTTSSSLGKAGLSTRRATSGLAWNMSPCRCATLFEKPATNCDEALEKTMGP
jgi:hypothetical protein